MADSPAQLALMLANAAGLADTAYEHVEACRSYITNKLPLSEGFSLSAANDLTNAEYLLLRARQDLKHQLDAAAKQLRDEQIRFMLERRATGSGDEAPHRSHAWPLVENITPVPERLDNDGATVKETAPDGHSYAGTVVRGGLPRSPSDHLGSEETRGNIDLLPGFSFRAAS